MTVQMGVYTLLSASQELADAMGVPLEGVVDHLHRTGAAIDAPHPFLTVRWAEDNFANRVSGVHNLELRAHDRDQSYDRVDAMLNAAKTVLTAVVHQQGITQIDWNGRSPDLFDDAYKTLTRYDSYAVAGGLLRKES